jgi:hypothetical protein
MLHQQSCSQKGSKEIKMKLIQKNLRQKLYFQALDLQMIPIFVITLSFGQKNISISQLMEINLISKPISILINGFIF